jgi:hypothetical protein
MKPILNLSGPRVEVNALFIQPTRWCALNCKGCYVKEHQGGEEGFHTPWNEQFRLFRKFYDGREAWANQITISVDDVHPDFTKGKHMVLFLDAVLATLREDKRPKEDKPEVHITCHTMQTLEQYFPRLEWNDFNLFSMVSFSVLSKKDEVPLMIVKAARRNIINYNMLIPKYDPRTVDWDAEAEWIRTIAGVVDHIYMVIFKSPVGGVRDLNVRIGDTNRMASDIVYIQNVLERLPPDVKAKVTTDGCLSDTVQFVRNKQFGCSSNVSRFQVWPDGTVSGCPYAFSGNGSIGKTAEDILENIKEARKRYDFREKCHLPQVYTTLTRQPRAESATQASR